MNTAQDTHQAKMLRKLLVESDRHRDPQALFLDPEVCFGLAEAIVGESDDYERTLSAARFACNAMRQCVKDKTVQTSAIEAKWLDRMEQIIFSMPDNSDGLLEKITKSWPGVFAPSEYGLTI
jgi:methanol--5-hydroxybenzimidazolylcobamide Co-methyltransferase